MEVGDEQQSRMWHQGLRPPEGCRCLGKRRKLDSTRTLRVIPLRLFEIFV